MKTFLMIYENKSKRLLEKYQENNDAKNTFDNWFLDCNNNIAFKNLKDHTIFYFTGSSIKEERKGGIIRHDNRYKMLMIENYPIYFKTCFENQGDVLIENSNIIKWDCQKNRYIILPNNDKLFKEIDFKIPTSLEVVIPKQEVLLRSNREFVTYLSHKDQNHPDLVIQDLKFKRFYKNCKHCKNDSEITISRMIDNRFFCPICKRIN